MSSWIARHRRVVRAPIVERIQRNEKLEEEEILQDIQLPNRRVDWNPSVKRYLSGGKLGDFIYQLYVIYYNYKYYGKKGILYIGNVGDNFRFGLEKTYNDTKDFILSQEYIEDYQIYKNQKYDLNLSNWRSLITPSNTFNWNQIYRKSFDVDWGKLPWIQSDQDSQYSSSILFNHSDMRYNKNIDINNIIHILKNTNRPIYFICFDESEYNRFSIRYQISLPIIVCSNILDMSKKINSCYLFVGNLSAPLAISLAMHKKTIGITPTDPIHYGDIVLNRGLNDIMPLYRIVNNEQEVESVFEWYGLKQQESCVEPVESIEYVEPVESIESVKSLEPMEPVKLVELAESVESDEPVESIESIELIEHVELVEHINEEDNKEIDEISDLITDVL
jgi:hypothetical protein